MMILNSLSLSLSLLRTTRKRKEKKRSLSLSFSLSPLARAPTRREVKRIMRSFFSRLRKQQQVDSDFRVFVCSARF